MWVNYRQGYWVFLAHSKSPDISFPVRSAKKLSDPSKSHWKKLEWKIHPWFCEIQLMAAHPFTKLHRTRSDHRFCRCWQFFCTTLDVCGPNCGASAPIRGFSFCVVDPHDLLCFWRGALADRIYIPLLREALFTFGTPHAELRNLSVPFRYVPLRSVPENNHFSSRRKRRCRQRLS